MRLAIALLYLLSAGDGLSIGGQNPRYPRQNKGRTLLPAKSSGGGSSGRGRTPRSAVDSDVFSQVVESESKKRKPRKRVVARPPLVDSALLRFLSKQKRLREQNAAEADSSEVANSGGENDTKERTSYSLLDAIQQKQRTLTEGNTQKQPTRTTQQSDNDRGASVEATTLTQSEADGPPKMKDSLDLWMGQFNKKRVAKVLMRAGGGGVDETLANQAGECVQRVVMARTARRRVRKFLKERDSMWVEGTAGTNGIDKKGTDKTTGQPEYGFGDVVDVLIENGLTAKDIATILTHTPSIALMMPKRSEGSERNILGGETVEETVQRALSDLLCSTLKLRKYDARKVLRNCPGLLTKRGSRSAQQVVAAMTKLGVSTSSIARDKNGLPMLLSRSPAALFRLISFLASDAIRMPINKIGPLIRRSDCLVLLNVVAPVIRFQPEQEATTGTTTDKGEGLSDVKILPAFVGRTMEERKKLIDAAYDRMSVTAWTIRNEIGTSDLGKVIAAYPNVLLLDASKQVLPAAEYLMDELGIWEDDLARVLQLYPALLGLPIEKMQGVVDFFIAQGVEEENMASIFRSFPALLTLDIEKDMIPVTEFLRSIGIKNVGRFISRLPPIMGYSLEQDLIPKWEFVRDIYTYPSFELSKFPAFFAYPLDRVEARFDYLRDVKRLPISLIAPDLVLRYGDRDFSVKVAGDDDDGAAYAMFLKERRQEKSPGKRRSRQRRN